MTYSRENGYIPRSIEEIMLEFIEKINEQFNLEYTQETFEGTNIYKYFYAIAQMIQNNETKTSEIFAKAQNYFEYTNEILSRPVVTNPGLISALNNAGYTASVKPIESADAGKVYICVDVDDEAEDYAETKLEICNIIKNSTIAGTVTQGTESESITLTNGQSFDFKYNLPTRIEPKIKLTIATSENNQFVIETPDEIKAKLIANIEEKYALGKNFEPQKYFTFDDAPWAGSILLEYSLDDGANWLSTIYDADYDELFEILLANITLVES